MSDNPFVNLHNKMNAYRQERMTKSNRSIEATGILQKIAYIFIFVYGMYLVINGKYNDAVLVAILLELRDIRNYL